MAVSGLAKAVTALALAGAVLWLGLPVAASAVAGAAVAAAGLHGDDVTVSVVAAPPLKLLLLEADAVRVRAGPSTFRGARLGDLDVTVHDVGLGAPPGALEGTIHGLEITDASGGAVRADTVQLSGSADTPRLRIEVSPTELSAWLGRSWPPALGAAAPIALSAPDEIRISTSVGEISARLVPTADGGLEVVVSGPGASTLRFTVLTPGPDLPLTLSGAAIEGGVLVLRGTLDRGSLGL